MRRLAIAVVLVLVALRCLRGPSCRLDQDWAAEAPFYDYLNSVSFDRGRGELVYGDHQVVRTTVRFRYERDRRAISFAYDGYARRRIEYELKEGKFEVVEPGPGGDRRVRFRCRLRFAEDPFPPGAYHHPRTDYYACRER
jgi:hypothetical protein